MIYDMIKELEEKCEDYRNFAEEDMNLEYWERYEAYKEAIEIVKKYDWIDVKDVLPKCEEEVQITTRRKYKDKYFYIVTNAFYEDGTMLENDSDWHWNECDFEKYYDEEDCYIIDEGWWEYKHYNADDVYNNSVDDEVIAWKPLSKPYIRKGE
jgi:hypothetical protein